MKLSALSNLSIQLLAAIIFLGGPAVANAADNAPSQADLDALNAAIENVEQQLASTTSEREQLQEALFNTEQEIARLDEEVGTLTSQLESKQQELQTLEEQSADLQIQKQEQQDIIALYIRNAWAQGQQEFLKLLLNQENIAKGSQVLQYYRYFSEARSDRIEAYATLLDDISDKAVEVADSKTELESLQQNLNTDRQELAGKQTERQQQMLALDNLLEEAGEELARLVQEREELTILIEELNRSITLLTPPQPMEPFAGMRGKLPWPVAGRLMNSYGAKHELGDVTWQGVNIEAAAGTEIQAVHNGRVVFADWFGNSGLLLIIDHGGGFMSLYGQNRQLYRAVGDWVNAGEIIATVGNTGGQQDPALYYELRQDGSALDPTAWSLPRP